MDAPRTIVLVTFLSSAAVIITLSIPLIRGRVAPNPWYGFRVKRTLEDPQVWYPANRYAAGWLLAVGLALALAATGLYPTALSFVQYALTCAGVCLLGVALAVLQSFRRLRKLAADK
jgi:hypothetical protein